MADGTDGNMKQNSHEYDAVVDVLELITSPYSAEVESYSTDEIVIVSKDCTSENHERWRR